jgi:orotidine-5'-phosphate decarboxylase
MSETVREPRVIVALDYPSSEQALAFVRCLVPGSCRLKVGKELFVTAGPELVGALQGLGFEIFLDLKFHDIPNTVAQACEAAARLGVWMLNVHASGGSRMMTAAREALDKAARRPRLIAVTVLTSMRDEDLSELGLAGVSAGEQALRLAALAQRCGLDGVVCSAREAGAMRARFGSGFQLVTPGIRPADAAADDQARVTTPGAAMQAGSTYLVIGRPITRALDPVVALREIENEISAVTPGMHAVPGQ